MAALTVEQATEIAETVAYRQRKFPDETVEWSVMVVLLNHGDKYTRVRCIGNEWNGIKDELEPREGVPRCPNGHPLLEYGTRIHLGYVEDK